MVYDICKGNWDMLVMLHSLLRCISYKPQFKLPMKVTPSISIYKLAHYTSKLFYKLTRWFSKGRLQALVGVSSCVVILYYVFFCLAWHTLPKSSK